LGVLPYVNTLFNDFVYDDHFQIVQNPYVHSFRYLREIFTTTVWSFQGAQGVTNYFRPMMTLGYLLTYKIAGAIPFSFHLASVALNGLAVCLVYCLLRLFSGERVALIAAGLFALHPVHSESVAWIAAVTDLELTVFYLATSVLFLRLQDSEHFWRARSAMCATFALALLSKEQAMTLPVMAMIFEHFYRDDRTATTLREKLSRYGPLWAIAVLYFAIRTIILGGVARVVLRPNLSLYQTALSAVALIGKYLGKLIWPAQLTAFYVFHPSNHVTNPAVLAGLASVALSAALFGVLRKRARILSFGLLWIFATLGPVLNARWMPAAVFGERYLYLPSVAFCWLFGWGAVSLWSADVAAMFRPLTRAVPVLLAVIALLYGIRTVARNREWRSDEVLFRQVLEFQPDATLIRADLGGILFQRSDYIGAEREWLHALSTFPGNSYALDSLAVLRQRENRYAESIDYSSQALRITPVYTIMHIHLAETLTVMGRAEEAESQFRIAAALSPLSTQALNGYGKFLFEAGRTADARTEYERSAAVDATSEAYDRLGDIYLSGKESTRAEQAYRRAILVDPFDGHAHIGVGQVLESAGRPEDALREYKAGLQMDPSDPMAKAGLIRICGSTPGKSHSHSGVLNN
jgi:tetratricopeptide (TPR) repeat protein